MVPEVIVSSFNELDNNRYYDPESQSSFEFDHGTQVQYPSVKHKKESYSNWHLESIFRPIPRP